MIGDLDQLLSAYSLLDCVCRRRNYANPSDRERAETDKISRAKGELSSTIDSMLEACE